MVLDEYSHSTRRLLKSEQCLIRRAMNLSCYMEIVDEIGQCAECAVEEAHILDCELFGSGIRSCDREEFDLPLLSCSSMAHPRL